MRWRFSTLLLTLGLAACSAAPPAPSTLLRRVETLNPDGSRTAVTENDLTAFQRYIRSRLPLPPARQLSRLFLLEVDLPRAAGTEGAYLVVAMFGGSAEFEYFEQIDHLPRRDRYFHRRMTAAETARFLDFIQAHPVEALPVKHANADEPPEIVFRYTDAQVAKSTTVTLVNPTGEDHPAIDLIHAFGALRDAAANTSAAGAAGEEPTPPLTCTYIISIPLGAQILFADPQRRVLHVSFALGETAAQDDLRAEIFPPLDFSFAQWTPSSSPPRPQWYALRGDAWVKSDPPAPLPVATQPSATNPAGTQGAASTAPATAPAATWPARRPTTFAIPDLSRFTDSNDLPAGETWRAEPAETSTTVWHYVPFDPHHGQWLGFVVPSFTFDDDHMQIDSRRRRLYLIHDDQLFALPIPAAALMVR